MNDTCQKCNSKRILRAGAKCSDMFAASVKEVDYEGYVPNDLGIGGGDYVEFNLCMDCGQLQGKFPLPVSSIEKDIDDEELLEFFDECFNVGEQFSHINSNRRSRIRKSAEHICPKLESFVKNLMQFHCDMYSKTTVPTVAKLIEMYRANSFELEE